MIITVISLKKIHNYLSFILGTEMTVQKIVLFLLSPHVWQRFYSVFLLKITYTKHNVLLNLLLLHLGPRYPGLHPYEQVPFKSWHCVTFKQCTHSAWHPSSYVPFSHSFMKYAYEKKTMLRNVHIMKNFIPIMI